jgi:Rod binding domain-containing protein
MSTSLPPVDQATLPADIRNGSQKTKQAYTAALGFERMLVEQLAKAMNSTAQPSDDSGDDGSDAATTTYRDMLPGALADGILSGGGLGLARQLVPADDTNTKGASS